MIPNDDRLQSLECGSGGPLGKGELAAIARELLDARRAIESHAQFVATVSRVVIDVPPGTLDGQDEITRLRDALKRACDEWGEWMNWADRDRCTVGDPVATAEDRATLAECREALK